MIAPLSRLWGALGSRSTDFTTASMWLRFLSQQVRAIKITRHLFLLD